MYLNLLENLLRSGLKLAAPLWLTATGETFSERSGVINIGLEGMMLVGAFAGMVVGYYSANPWLGLMAGVAAGALLSALFGALAIYAAADQIIVGAGINLLAAGLTGFLFRRIFGVTGAALTVASFTPVRIPWLADMPLLGSVCFEQPALLYLAFAVVPIAAFVLKRTHLGLAIRACGEHSAAADTAGLNVFRMRFGCVLFCGAMCGAAGAYLSLAHANTFVEGLTAGRGFIALALVIFGRWQPWGIFFASLFFGCANALQFQFQALGSGIPYQIFLMLPYVLTLLVLIFARGGVQGPAELGKVYRRE
ncbi:ABC transporter permease [candidate division KSB1 bacterium]|nr:ABC transporter permease [candidate division KSB1 bacterium]